MKKIVLLAFAILLGIALAMPAFAGNIGGDSSIGRDAPLYAIVNPQTNPAIASVGNGEYLQNPDLSPGGVTNEIVCLNNSNGAVNRTIVQTRRNPYLPTTSNLAVLGGEQLPFRLRANDATVVFDLTPTQSSGNLTALGGAASNMAGSRKTFC